MTVEVKKPETTPAETPTENTTAPAPAPKKQRYFHLVGVSRYVWNNALYERGVAYPLPEGREDEFLSHEMEPGKQVFVLYTPKPKPQVVSTSTGDNTPIAPLPTPTTGEINRNTPAQPTSINVGDDSEIADILGNAGQTEV